MKSVRIEKERYYDSVFLMRISDAVKGLPGIADAVVALATPTNVENLKKIGFSSPELSAAGPNDLVIAIDAADEDAVSAAFARVEELLREKVKETGKEARPRPATLAKALEVLSDANLALISVPGAYAAREARNALRNGLHVMLFSDNVSVEDEVALKDEAIGRGLLMMGPDCGTAIVNGVPLGFANALRSGPIGIVGASGTGIQEISSLIHRYGGGISQAIGTGGRDLTEAVEGRMTIFGIEALAADPKTEVIIVVSKAPAPPVAEKAVAALVKTGKPRIVQFIGQDEETERGNVKFAASLAEAARLACDAVGIPAEVGKIDEAGISRIAEGEAAKLLPEQTRLVGLFCGGTLAQEAWHILREAGIPARSNVALDKDLKIAGDETVEGHLLLDLGDDVFTQGRPHPMIEPSLRDEGIPEVAKDPKVGVILLDLVLGYGAHPDPGTGLAERIREAKGIAAARGGHLTVIASITGTDQDPQGYGRQRRALEEAGAIVMDSNEEAARLAAAIIEGRGR